jgi:hypothetical protein
MHAMPVNSPAAARCEAASLYDPSLCEGPVDAVVVTEYSSLGVLDHVHPYEGLLACLRHGSRILASMIEGRVGAGPCDRVDRRPGPPACVETYRRSLILRAFAWLSPTHQAGELQSA